MQTLGELMSIYKEDFDLNDQTGELMIDGRPKIQFYKNYLMPSGQGGTPTIEPINSEGPNLNDSTPLNYFFDRFIQESKIPASRFSTPEGGSSSTYSNTAEGWDKDEIRFYKFIERLRTIFQDIMIKPLWVQMVKKHKELEKDFVFKSQLGLNFFSDNPFKLNQEIEVINKRKESVTAMVGLMGDEEKPYFSVPFLVENFLGIDKQDLKVNEEVKERKKKEKEKKEKEKKEGEATGGEAEPAEGGEAEPAEGGEAPAEAPTV
jgi:rRNA processing protein Gar1